MYVFPIVIRELSVPSGQSPCISISDIKLKVRQQDQIATMIGIFIALANVFLIKFKETKSDV